MEIPHADSNPAVEQKVYLWTDGEPMTVDPIDRDRWITEANGWQHKQSVTRRELLNQEALIQSMPWHLRQQGEVRFSAPTVGELNAAPKWPIPESFGCRVGMHGALRDTTRFGKLPVIEQMIYDGSLQNKSKGDIEHEIREAERRHSHRLFDTNGYTR